MGVPFDETAIRSALASSTDKCPCCGTKMGSTPKRGKNRWASVDRVIPSAGYVNGNIAIICYRCNVLKSDGLLTEFECIVTYIRKTTQATQGIE